MDNSKLNFWQKSLAKTNDLFKSIGSKESWGESELAQCEESLLLADAGISPTSQIITKIRKNASHKTPLKELLYKEILNNISKLERSIDDDLINTANKPKIILIAGINGAGKTTSIAKITNYFLAHNKSVILAAADTFRAAAREQLKHWGEHQNVRVIEQQSSDPAAVCFDTVQSANSQKYEQKTDIAIIDTAGRLATQKNLMAELTRIHKVCGKAMEGAPHENWLVLDGTSGQNTISQVQAFNQSIPLTGLIVTKLDGSAKAGFLLALAQIEPIIPVVFIGLGEKVEDLQKFNAKQYASSLLDFDNAEVVNS